MCVFFLLIDLYCVNQGTCPWSVTHQQLTTTTTTTQAAITKKKPRFLFCRLLQVQCFRQSENTSLVAENQKKQIIIKQVIIYFTVLETQGSFFRSLQRFFVRLDLLRKHGIGLKDNKKKEKDEELNN